MDCTECGGPLAFLGLLGNVEWYRCVDCGAEQCDDQIAKDREPEPLNL